MKTLSEKIKDFSSIKTIKRIVRKEYPGIVITKDVHENLKDFTLFKLKDIKLWVQLRDVSNDLEAFGFSYVLRMESPPKRKKVLIEELEKAMTKALIREFKQHLG